VNVLLVHTRELAVEFIALLGLADIELGLPGRDLARTLARVGVIVLEETEERSEGDAGVGVVEVSGEESHFVRLGVVDGFESVVLQVGRGSLRKRRFARVHRRDDLYWLLCVCCDEKGD